jgi:hypothetical protein
VSSRRRPADPIHVATYKALFMLIVIAAAQRYILERVEIISECWIWKGGGDGRYGHAYFLGKRYKAHVLSYLAFVGCPKKSHVIDHDHCSKPACAHWRHLKAVTQSWNIKRAYLLGNVKLPRRYRQEEEE